MVVHGSCPLSFVKIRDEEKPLFPIFVVPLESKGNKPDCENIRERVRHNLSGSGACREHPREKRLQGYCKILHIALRCNINHGCRLTRGGSLFCSLSSSGRGTVIRKVLIIN